MAFEGAPIDTKVEFELRLGHYPANLSIDQVREAMEKELGRPVFIEAKIGPLVSNREEWSCPRTHVEGSLKNLDALPLLALPAIGTCFYLYTFATVH